MIRFFNIRYLASSYRRYHTFARFYVWHYIGFTMITAILMKLLPTTHFIKLLILLCGFGFLLGTFMFAKRQRNRNPIILMFTIVLAFMLILSVCVRFYNTLPAEYGAVEKGYIKYALTYQGVPYRRGGETRYGVDTPGLAKASVVRSALEYGIKNHNANLMAKALKLWWQCLNSEKLLSHTGSYTETVGQYSCYDDIKTGDLQYGDMLYIWSRDLMVIYTGPGSFLGASEGSGVKCYSYSVFGNSRLTHLKWTIFREEGGNK